MHRFYHVFILSAAAVACCAFAVPGADHHNRRPDDLPKILAASFKKDTFNIVKFGAKPDGITLNSLSIQKAIDACSHNGGGTVFVPPGLWLTGPLVLKSNVNLSLSAGAVLQFSDKPSDYPLVQTNWEGLDAIRAQSPISASDAENVGITGGGSIDGAGQAWRPVKKSKVTPPEWNQLIKSGGVLDEKQETWYPSVGALKGSLAKRPGVIAEGYDRIKADAIKEFLRPNLVSLLRCKRVLLAGVTFQNSPAWCLHPLLSQHITVSYVTVRNPWNAQNGDGIDVESCSHVLIENSSFDVGDDAICMKSGRDEEGRKRGVATEAVIVRNCTVYHGHGGFVIGSEMSGGVNNVFVSDCNFIGTDVGLRFKTARGRGGVVEQIFVNNIRMSAIGGAAILFDMYYMAQDPLTIFGGDGKVIAEPHPVTEATPQFRDFYIDGVVCKGAETAIFVRGLPEMSIRNIQLENISIQGKNGFVCTDGEDIILKNATLHSDASAAVVMQNSKGVSLENISYRTSDVFLQISGQRSKNINIRRTDTSKVKKAVELGDGVSNSVVNIQ